MSFSMSVPLSRLISLLPCNIPARWVRLVGLAIFFVLVLSGLPVHLKRDGANAQGSHPRRTQGPTSHNLLNLDETYVNNALRRPQQEYGHRSGRSWAPIVAQGGGVVTVNPSAYTGGGCCLNFSGPASASSTGTWSGFPSVSGQIVSARLKMDWSASKSAGGGGGSFSLEYSLTNGSSWNGLVNIGGSSFSQSSSVDVLLPAGQDITQVRVRFSINGGGGPGTSINISSSVYNIRIEVEVADTTAPVITGVSSSAVTQNSATISWTTNENSDSQVEYRTNAGSWQPTELNTAPVTAHSQGLSGLTAGTPYYYRVKSKDAAGNLATSTEFTFTTLSVNDAAFVSQSVLATMTAGEVYPVTVTMLNQGITTWTPGQLYRLGSQNPQDNTIWGTGRVDLPSDSINPGATATFSFVVTAPSSPGSYNFQWQMVNAVEWFGAMTPNIAVQVVPRNDSAEFISQTEFSGMEAGAAQTVSITFRNTGNTTWTAANHYRLGSWNPVNNGTWGLGRVDLGSGELVPPNALKTFSFQVVAPSTPGSYNFQWRMLRELVNWFGAESTNLVVAAISPNCIANVPTDHWRGEYFNGINPSGAPLIVRNDGASFLNFDFGLGSPGAACGIVVDGFSARWTRMVYFEAGTYRFSVTGDDGVKLYVGGQLIINAWLDQGATTYTENVTFNNSGFREVKLEYFESGGPGVAILTWVDLTGVNCLPNAPLPLISSIPQTGGRENIASTAPSQAPKRCDPKIVTVPRAPGSE